jgi:hypothetical protein
VGAAAGEEAVAVVAGVALTETHGIDGHSRVVVGTSRVGAIYDADQATASG